MSIDVHRHVERTVARDLHNDSWRHIHRKQKADVRMPHCVQRNDRNTNVRALLLEDPVQFLGSIGVPSGS